MLRPGFVFHTFPAARGRMCRCCSVGTRRCERSRIPWNPAALPCPPPRPLPRGLRGGRAGSAPPAQGAAPCPGCGSGKGSGSHPQGDGNAVSRRTGRGGEGSVREGNKCPSPRQRSCVPRRPRQRQSSIDDWTKTQWREINVEQMDVQLRRFAKAGPTAIYLCNLSVSVPPLPHSSHPLGCFGEAFSSRRPPQTFWDSSFIKVEDEVKSVVVNAVQELSTEKTLEEIMDCHGIF
ncbi:dynein axonemal heavy chain 11 [Passer domesticus]|uniref:dynein axonemal heavy chain 11 n=1 Tax=Passer domesticus TaxID=48849 RepID=UPI0030FE548F